MVGEDEGVAKRQEGGSREASFFLDAQLNNIFGVSFAPVVEFETNRELGRSLYDALRTDPSGAIGVLLKIFRRDEAVHLIFNQLTERLAEMPPSPHSSELLGIFQRIEPLSVVKNGAA